MKIHRYCLGLILGVLLIGEGAVMAAGKVSPPLALHQYAAGIALNPSQDGSPLITDYTFTDGEWVLKIKQKGSDLQYDGANLQKGKGIRITGVKRSGTKSRKIYTWQNRNISYVVSWQPADPLYARLQVIESGRLVLNRLLEAKVEEEK
jgi:hypothetical protein